MVTVTHESYDSVLVGIEEQKSLVGLYGKGFSGRFVNQEQWERWRAKRKLVSGSEYFKMPLFQALRALLRGIRGYRPRKKNVDIVGLYAKS